MKMIDAYAAQADIAVARLHAEALRQGREGWSQYDALKKEHEKALERIAHLELIVDANACRCSVSTDTQEGGSLDQG